MMSCATVGGSRGLSIPHNLPKSLSFPTSNSNSNSSTVNVKKRRTRRGRPRDSFAKAFYTVNPPISQDEGDGDLCPLLKIEARSPAEKTELLQELPALLSRLREAEQELPLILSNFNFNANVKRADYPSPSPSNPSPCSHEFDEEVESFLESDDIEGGMDSLLASPSPDIQLPELECHPHQTSYVSAIRGLRRSSHGVCNHGQQMRGKKSKDMWAEAPPGKLSLKLDYEQVLSAWSGRGSLYIQEDGRCPDMSDYDSASNAIENVEVGLVPDASLIWKGAEEFNVKVNNGMREARVLRYRQKRQTRLFSNKIRYQVRKLNAEKRPRLK
ncbi:hypothetical protein KI387_031760, partial [Taxus chinensis]